MNLAIVSFDVENYCVIFIILIAVFSLDSSTCSIRLPIFSTFRSNDENFLTKLYSCLLRMKFSLKLFEKQVATCLVLKILCSLVTLNAFRSKRVVFYLFRLSTGGAVRTYLILKPTHAVAYVLATSFRFGIPQSSPPRLRA